LLAVVQLVLGAQLRHLPASASLATFRLALMFHLLVAGILLVQVVVLALRIARSHGHDGALTRPAWALVGLVVAQLALGAATWVVKYSWPWWLADYAWAARFTIHEQSMSQAMTVTAHVATGSLVLATSVMLALRSVRLVPRVTDQAAARGVRLGVLA
jgi:cytochrome c oxidase assembly protein subunit 15